MLDVKKFVELPLPGAPAVGVLRPIARVGGTRDGCSSLGESCKRSGWIAMESRDKDFYTGSGPRAWTRVIAFTSSRLVSLFVYWDYVACVTAGTLGVSL